MLYELKECVTGAEEKEYKTTVDITEKDGILTFIFTGEKTQFNCPFWKKYNKIHSIGDTCEILIGSDADRKVYYEIEISPENDLMIAKMTYNGEKKGKVQLKIDFVLEPFVESTVLKRKNGFVVTASFPKEKIMTGNEEIYFNAYRIETDGGKRMKAKQRLFALNPTLCGKFHTPSKYVFLKDYVEVL